MYEYSLGLYEKAIPDDVSLEEKLLIAKRTGYDYLELCVDLDPKRGARLDWSRKERRDFVDFMIDNDLHLTTLSLSKLRGCPLGLLDEAKNAEAFEIARKGIDLACDLGAQIVLINGYDVYDEESTPETRARYAKNLPLVAAMAAKRGVMVGIENAEKDFMNSIAKVAHWVDPVDSPFLKIYGDVGNTANAHGGNADLAIADIRSGKGRLVAMHLKDSVPDEYRFTHYGEGHVDFKRSVDCLKELGVRIFTAELFYSPEEDYVEKAAWVNNYLRGFFK